MAKKKTNSVSFDAIGDALKTADDIKPEAVKQPTKGKSENKTDDPIIRRSLSMPESTWDDLDDISRSIKKHARISIYASKAIQYLVATADLSTINEDVIEDIIKKDGRTKQ